MAIQHFRLNSRDEVARFEKLAHLHIVSRAGFTIKYISLVAAYDYCKGRADGGKVFTALLDIFINFNLLYLDLDSANDIWNKNFSKGKLKGGSILDSEAKFSGKWTSIDLITRLCFAIAPFGTN